MKRSMRILLIRPEVFWPRTSRAVFGFSLSFASRFLRKRRARDVFAVFESTIWARTGSLQTSAAVRKLRGGRPRTSPPTLAASRFPEVRTRATTRLRSR